MMVVVELVEVDLDYQMQLVIQHTASPLASPTGITATATAYPITVGAGGTGGPSCATAGSNSVFSTITSAGGGKEGPSSPPNAPAVMEVVLVVEQEVQTHLHNQVEQEIHLQ